MKSFTTLSSFAKSVAQPLVAMAAATALLGCESSGEGANVDTTGNVTMALESHTSAETTVHLLVTSTEDGSIVAEKDVVLAAHAMVLTHFDLDEGKHVLDIEVVADAAATAQGEANEDAADSVEVIGSGSSEFVVEARQHLSFAVDIGLQLAGDAVVNAESWMEGGAEAGGNSEAEANAEANTEADTEAEAEAEAEANGGASGSANADAEADANTEANTESETNLSVVISLSLEASAESDDDDGEASADAKGEGGIQISL